MTAFTPLKKYRLGVVLAPTFKLVECLCELGVTFLVRNIIDSVFTEGGSNYRDIGYALMMAAWILGVAVIGFSFTMITQYMAARTSSNYGYDLKLAIFAHLNRLSPKQIDDFGQTKALNLLGSDTYAVQNGIQMFMRLLVRAPFLVVGSLVAGFIINVYAGIVLAIGLICCALVLFVFMKKVPSHYHNLQGELDSIATSGNDLIRGVRVIHGFSKEEREEAKFASRADSYAKEARIIWRISSFINPLTFAFLNLALIGVLILGSFGFSYSQLSVGSIVALVSLLTQSLTALLQFSHLASNLSKGLASKKRIDAFFQIPVLIDDGNLEEEKKISMGEKLYDFKDVSLSFGGEAVLSKVNVSIAKGEHIGIIGGTGSGKSVFLSLLGRYNDVDSGEVIYKGHDIKNSKLENIRTHIAMVSQKGGLFSGTIKDNLDLGKGFSEEEIISALKKAEAYDFVFAYEDKMEHMLAEMGSNLSGGQRQRLLIARALLHYDELLVLDDATSALDYVTEAKIRKEIFAKKESTIVLVSQRVTSVMGCDRIYVFDNGKIVGEGKHDDLLKTCPVYIETYAAQVKQQ